MSALPQADALEPAGPVAQALGRIWPGARWHAEPLDGGMTNRNYRVELRLGGDVSRTLVVQEQLPDELAAVVGIRREIQARAIESIGPWGLAPDVLGYFPDLGVMVTDYVRGTLLPAVEDRRRALESVADVLHRLHARTAGFTETGPISDAFSGTAWLRDQVSRAAPELLVDFGWAIALAERIRRARGPYHRCLIHADVSEGNVILTPDSAVLIDWEYSGAGDSLFDLGDYAEKGHLSASDLEVVADRYLGGPDDNARAIVQTYRLVSMLREGLWSLQAGTTEFVHFDHMAYARTCLSRIGEIAGESQFQAALELLEERASPS